MELKGTIFDIQRNSLNDGPGIRTTVFLKGCPLNCLWCHNEESIDPRPQLQYFPEKCTHCMDCVAVCKPKAHIDDDGFHRVDFTACTTNWDCVKACAYDALARSGRVYSVPDIMQIVRKDLPYYKESGGGLTLSGGEPLVQHAFATELLKVAHGEGIHTCLDTSGHAATERLLSTLQHTDLYLYDYKATDPEPHRKFTGMDNRLILDNLRALDEAGARIILRCPLVPGVNDQDEHLMEIALLANSMEGISEVHLLSYHGMGSRKAEQLGRDARQTSLREADDSDRSRWKEILTYYHLTNFTIF